MTEFSERLKNARLERSISQATFAQKAGLQATAINHFETGRREPTIKNLKLLAIALGVSSDYLLGIEEEPPVSAPNDALLREAALTMIEAAVHVIRDFDGTHRLALAAIEVLRAIANESGRGEEQ
jgi:transcriptional regulator with XRE-family HTH domain